MYTPWEGWEGGGGWRRGGRRIIYGSLEYDIDAGLWMEILTRFLRIYEHMDDIIYLIQFIA